MRIAVWGLGRLGLPLALLLRKAGHEVVGVDVSSDRLEAISRRDKFSEPGVNELLQDELWIGGPPNSWKPHIGPLAVSIPARLTEQRDLDIVCVNTMLADTAEGPRLSMADVLDALDELAARGLTKPVWIMSTLQPGSMRHFVERYASFAPQIVYSPSFVGLGSVMKDLCEPTMRLIGTDASQGVAAVLVERIWQSLHITRWRPGEGPFVATRDLMPHLIGEFKVQYVSPLQAELIKFAQNAWFALKITFADQLAWVARDLGLDRAAMRTIREGVFDHPYARDWKKYTEPGLGFGGPCLPKESKAFGALAPGNLFYGLDETNEGWPWDWLERAGITKEHTKKTAVVLGRTYKPDTDVEERAQARQVVLALNTWAEGGFDTIKIFDPMTKPDSWPPLFGPDTALVFVATPHREVAELSWVKAPDGMTIIDPFGIVHLYGKDAERLRLVQ